MIGGVILAGGRATRMGGGDKPLRLIAGEPLLAHIVRRLRPQCAGLLLNANGDAGRFAAFGLPVLADPTTDFAGPLAGILTALDDAAARHPAWTHLVSVPGDCPFLPTDLAARLLAAAGAAGLPFACAGSGGWTHPVVGLWPVACRGALKAALAAGERKIDRFTADPGAAVAEWSTAPIDPFFNVNTPEDLLLAESLAVSLAAT